MLTNFKGKRLKQARERLGFTQEEFAERIGVSQSLVAQSEAELKYPSEDFIARAAAEARVQPHFFYREPVIEIGSGMFRAQYSMTKREEKEAYRNGEFVYELVAELLPTIKPIPLVLPRLGGVDPITAARQIKAAWALPVDAPVVNLLHQIEKAGVLVLGLPSSLGGRDAFSFWVGDRPVIALSKGAPGDRQRMTVSHEVAHLALQHAGRFRKEEDRQAYQFAGELLMPEKAMRGEMLPPITFSSIASLKPKWRVAIAALIQRAHDLKLVSERQYIYLRKQITAKGFREDESGYFPPEKPRLLRQLVEGHYRSSAELEQLANELGLLPKLLNEILDAHAPTTGAKEGLQYGSKLVALKKRK